MSSKATQLVIKPPLPPGVDEADLLAALNSYKEFKQVFFFKHFYLLCFHTDVAARVAKATLNRKLPVSVQVTHDTWRHEDPLNGPYPEASLALETNRVYVPRSFLTVAVLKKIAEKHDGFRSGHACLRGNAIQFATPKTAFQFLDHLTDMTNLLPYFVDTNDQAAEPLEELDQLGDVLNGYDSSTELDSTIGCSVRLYPHGDEIAVLMDLLASFWGFRCVRLLGDQEAIADFVDGKSARRFERYLARNTASVCCLEPAPALPTGVDGAEPEITAVNMDPAARSILVNTRGTLNLPGKRYEPWLESYYGFKACKYDGVKREVTAWFRTPAQAAAAAIHIHTTTNFAVAMLAPKAHDMPPTSLGSEPTSKADFQLDPSAAVAAKHRQKKLRVEHNQEFTDAGSEETRPAEVSAAAEREGAEDTEVEAHTQHPDHGCPKRGSDVLKTGPPLRRISRVDHMENVQKMQLQIMKALEGMRNEGDSRDARIPANLGSPRTE